MAKIYIGVGHGGNDPGACANGYKEKDLNLKVAKACYDHLKANGVSAIISRTNDVTESVDSKATDANNTGCTHVVDIHFNAGGGDGAEVLFYSGSDSGQTMGNNILNEIKALGQNSRGTKAKTDFAMLRDTNGIANIVECAFLDNKNDMTIADTDGELKNMGIAIAKGLMKTIGANSSTSKPIPTSKIKYRVYVNGKWLGWIEGYNDIDSNGYAGIIGSQIMGVQIQEDIEYRVRTTDGKWWSWIKGYNTTNSNGYAGTLKKPIDAIQIKGKTYRVSPVKSNYLGWITNYNTTDSNGYAGIYGKPIDRLQIQ